MRDPGIRHRRVELPEELIRGLTIVKPNQTEIMKVLGRGR